MYAAVYTNDGGPDVVNIKNVTTPTPNDNEVLVKVHASTVNRTDCGFRSGKSYILRLFSGILNQDKPSLGVILQELWML